MASNKQPTFADYFTDGDTTADLEFEKVFRLSVVGSHGLVIQGDDTVQIVSGNEAVSITSGALFEFKTDGLSIDGTQVVKQQQAAIANPAATLVDLQAKLQALLVALRAHGLIAP